MNQALVFLAVLLLTPPGALHAGDAPATHRAVADVAAFKARLLAATTRHLNLLLNAEGEVVSLKGKTGEGEAAFAF